MSYVPPTKILENYADVLINFALNSGQGIKKGEVVMVRLHEAAKPMYIPLRNAVLKAGAHPFMDFIPDDVQPADFYELANDEQLDFFMNDYYKGLVKQIDHSVYLISETNKQELAGVDPQKIMRRSAAFHPFMKWRQAKEAKGQFTWTLGLYGTPAMAAEVGMPIEEYWQQIIDACYLDDPDPVASWRNAFTELEKIQKNLNGLAIEELHVQGEDADLRVKIGSNRSWLGGSGRNIPSFELFISPDWRGTEGWIKFNQPLYHYGNRIQGVELRFENGLVKEATAKEGEDVLQAMIATKNADKIGEYSLTDRRFSRITKVMAETLYDENIGGPFGNTHLALGNAYQDSYPGNPAAVTARQWKDWGYNESVVHTDIVSTADRTVTATLADGSKKVIYQDGQFTV